MLKKGELSKETKIVKDHYSAAPGPLKVPPAIHPPSFFVGGGIDGFSASAGTMMAVTGGYWQGVAVCCHISRLKRQDSTL